MEWISVKDRFPSNEEYYLVTDGTDRIAIACFCVQKNSFWPDNLDDNYIDCYYKNYWEEFEVDNITHWIPLPLPPDIK